MERAAYKALADEEATHWWFQGRRAVLNDLIEKMGGLHEASKIVDVGCGTGGNLEMLSRFGDVTGLEFDPEARSIAKARGIGSVEACDLRRPLHVPDASIDLIAMFDVLEHLEDDVGALTHLAPKLNNDGRIILSVPACPWLWSEHDVLHHHHRRYTRRSLKSVLERAGLKVYGLGYFNTLLFPLAVAQRGLEKISGWDVGAAAAPREPVNGALARIFSFERRLVGRVHFPVGLSLWAIAAPE